MTGLHGMVVVCKRWYQQEMARYLSYNKVFEECDTMAWEDVERQASAFNRNWCFRTVDGVGYNYGIWMPTKQKFRYIAGTRSKHAQSSKARIPGPPRQPLYEAHKTLVRLLQ